MLPSVGHIYGVSDQQPFGRHQGTVATKPGPLTTVNTAGRLLERCRLVDEDWVSENLRS
jgi:hypothetical protein